MIEDLRVKAITIDDRNRIVQENIPVYDNLLDCYIRLKNWEKALEIAELSKSRSLSDLLNLKSADLQPKSPDAESLAIVRELGDKYSDLTILDVSANFQHLISALTPTREVEEVASASGSAKRRRPKPNFNFILNCLFQVELKLLRTEICCGRRRFSMLICRIRMVFKWRVLFFTLLRKIRRRSFF